MATLLFLLSVSAGEPASPPSDSDDPSGGSTPIDRPAGPDTYLLPDKEGKLQKVLGFRYEDFVEAFKVRNGVAETTRKPRYSLQRFVVTGRAGQTYAELHVEIGIVFDAEGPIGVPIGLGRALLRGPPTYDGTDTPLVHFDASAGAYVVWVQSTAEKVPQTLGLDVLVPLATAGDEQILRLAAPRATSSRLILRVEQPRARARVSEESVLVSTRDTKPGTELTVAGLDGQFELGWQPDGRSPFEPSTVLEATGTILARLDGQRVITEATLTVRGFGGTFDRFVIGLPAGSQLLAISDPSYAVFPGTEKAPQENGEGSGELVEIRLDEATVGPVEIHCVVQQSFAAAAAAPDGPAPAGLTAGSSFELSGFDVRGAVRQSGYLALDVIGDWYVRWGAMVR
ncbi:MAG: hypothetical protein ACC645_19150, partial [Pirellulales bacterium]